MLDQVHLELGERHATWLEDVRKIPSELAAEMGIVSMGPHLAFEYRRRGALLWRQQRIETTEGKTFRCWAPDGRTLKEAGVGLTFWQEDDLCSEASPETPRIITEGQFDTCAFRMAGATFVGSVPNGARDRPSEDAVIEPGKDSAFAYLWHLDEAKGLWRPRGGLASCHKIILATDGDKAGQTLRDELALRLGRDRCWYVTYPDGCKDANDVLIRYGAEAGVEMLMDMIIGAKPLVPSNLVPITDVPEFKREIVDSGWPELNQHLRITRPELMVITGPPNHGKSQFCLALGANLAYRHGWKGAILQFEDDVERNKQDLIRYWLAREGHPYDPQSEAYTAAVRWIGEMFVTISPDEGEGDTRFDLAWLHRNIREAATHHGCKWVAIDPWNEIEHVFQRGQSEHHYLNDAIRDIKRVGRRYRILTMIVTHPDKASGRIKDIDELDLYAISGGQTWNNKADRGIIVLRPDLDSPETLIKVSKSKRHATMGRPGTSVMRFAPLKATFEFVRPYTGAE